MDITGIGSIFDFGGKIIDKIFPNKDEAEKAKLAMLQLQQAGDFKELEGQLEIAKGQIAVNAEEAKSEKWWKAGWRPFIGWVCGFALMYNYIAMPLLVWSVKCFYVNAPAMPALDMGELMVLLFGMLGIGTLRTVDKKVTKDCK